jgi:hypothetical protein
MLIFIIENFVGSDDESSSINDNINIQNQKFKVKNLNLFSRQSEQERIHFILRLLI